MEMNRGRNDQKRWKLTLSFIPSCWWRLCMFHRVQTKSFFYGAKTPRQVCLRWASWKCATAPWWPVEEESTSKWGGDNAQQLLRTLGQVGSEFPQHHTSNAGIGKSGVGQNLVHCFSPRGVIRFRLPVCQYRSSAWGPKAFWRTYSWRCPPTQHP